LVIALFCIIFPLAQIVAYAESFQSHQSTQEINNQESGFWILNAPQDLPAIIRPGFRSGDSRTQAYLDEFIPLFGKDNVFMFFDTKQVIDNYEAQEQNFGCGIRGIFFDDSLILGGNVFFDQRKTRYRNHFRQIGFGLEALSQYLDLRTNFYLPLTKKKTIGDEVSYRFGSTSLIKSTSAVYEEPMRGLDYETGTVVPGISKFVETRAYIGGYHYFSKVGKNIHGVRARMEIKPTPAFNIDLEVTRDRTSSTEGYAGCYVSLPFSIGNLLTGKNPFKGWKEATKFKKGLRSLKKRLVDPVVRDLDIVSENVSANPVETTQISGLVYVNNSNTTGVEDGSKEHPYNTIQEGVNNVSGDKWVYVFAGSGNYNESVTLSNSVTLWGAGYNGGFNGIQTTTSPVISGTGLADCITLADNTKVMGFKIQEGGAAFNEIIANNKSNITIQNNTLTQSSGGICIIDGSNIIIKNNALSFINGGIVIVNGNANNSNYILENNTVSFSTVTAGVLIISVANTISDIKLQSNIISSNTGFGV
jgi:hypothetical protein